jgi:hypothetical protein
MLDRLRHRIRAEGDGVLTAAVPPRGHRLSLEQMGQRMRAAPAWIEPSADEKVQLSRQLDEWFGENDYYGH